MIRSVRLIVPMTLVPMYHAVMSAGRHGDVADQRIDDHAAQLATDEDQHEGRDEDADRRPQQGAAPVAVCKPDRQREQHARR